MLKPILFFVFAALLLNGCSRPSENEPSAANTESTEAPALDDAAASALDGTPEQPQVINRPHYHTVEIKQMKFIPEELTVSKGDTVVWINKGITTHDVTELNNSSWTSSTIPVGASWSKVITQSDDYYCSIHVVMKGKLVVQPD